MEIRIDKQSEVSVRQQLAEQIIFSIATDKLKPGQALPSVRALARRLKIHHNTVSEAYQDLVRRTWLVGRRGRRLVVRPLGELAAWTKGCDVDDLINATIRVARQQGYSLQSLRERVRTRLLAEPPDHVLVVEDDPGLRRLIQEEIRAALDQKAEGCSLADLVAHPGMAIGALTVAGHSVIADVDPLVPKTVPAIPLAFSAADDHLELLRKLRQPSIIVVVSVSAAFLQTARSVLASALGRRQTWQDRTSATRRRRPHRGPGHHGACRAGPTGTSARPQPQRDAGLPRPPRQNRRGASRRLVRDWRYRCDR